jgi:adenosylcobinamide kinase/adenosylcobinamide-phosphate guanylyltransferase
MTVLVLGPNGSGKSACAEKIAAGMSGGALYYVATMIPFGEEGQTRVAKHRKQREGLGFLTVEQPSRVSEISLPQGATVLLEDVSNLLGNALFEHGGDEDAVFGDIAALCAKCRNAVLVSIDGLTQSPGYDGGTNEYIAALNRLNSRLAKIADEVIHRNALD